MTQVVDALPGLRDAAAMLPALVDLVTALMR
jgi:hypothetical protein